MEGAGAPYVAAFAFEGTEAGNLQIGLGELVIVTDSSREDWWIGHRAGDPSDSGSFPKAYVKPAPEPEPAPEPADVGSADAAPQTNAAGSKPTAEEGVPPAAATASDATAAKAAAEAKAAAFLAGPAHVACAKLALPAATAAQEALQGLLPFEKDNEVLFVAIFHDL